MQYYFILTSSAVFEIRQQIYRQPKEQKKRNPKKQETQEKKNKLKEMYLLLQDIIKIGEIKTPSGTHTHTQHLVPAGNFAERLSFFPQTALNFLGIRYPRKYGFFPIRLFHSESFTWADKSCLRLGGNK